MHIPSFLQPRRRSEQALLALMQPAYIDGVSTRKVDDRVQSLGLSGIAKSASRLLPVNVKPSSHPLKRSIRCLT